MQCLCNSLSSLFFGSEGWVTSMPSVPREKNAVAHPQLQLNSPETDTAAAHWPCAEGCSRHHPWGLSWRQVSPIQQCRPLFPSLGWNKQASEREWSWQLKADKGRGSNSLYDTIECALCFFCPKQQINEVSHHLSYLSSTRSALLATLRSYKHNSALG